MKLSVYPNPFVALGADGMPCGRVLVEPGHPRPYDILGGKIERQKLDRADDESAKKVRDIDTRDTRISGRAVVQMRPIDVPNVQYIRERIQCGDLVAANLETWRALGYPKKGFRAPLDVLADAARKAIDEWNASHEDPPELADYALGEVDGEIKLFQGGLDAPLGKTVGLATLTAAPDAKNAPPAPGQSGKPLAPPA